MTRWICAFALAGCSASAPASSQATEDAATDITHERAVYTVQPIRTEDAAPESTAPISATVDVTIRGVFPMEVHVSRGGSVTWVFHASEELVSGFECTRDGMWRTGVVPAGESFTMRFSGSPGPYPYFIEISCWYAGVVVIDP